MRDSLRDSRRERNLDTMRELNRLPPMARFLPSKNTRKVSLPERLKSKPSTRLSSPRRRLLERPRPRPRLRERPSRPRLRPKECPSRRLKRNLPDTRS